MPDIRIQDGTPPPAAPKVPAHVERETPKHEGQPPRAIQPPARREPVPGQKESEPPARKEATATM